jgi:hypothetical protein
LQGYVSRQTLRRFEIPTPQDYSANCKISIHPKARFDNLFLAGRMGRKTLQDLATIVRAESRFPLLREENTLGNLILRERGNSMELLVGR